MGTIFQNFEIKQFFLVLEFLLAGSFFFSINLAAMVFGWIIVLIVAMVGTQATNKLKRTKKNQEEGEYISLDDDDSETELVD